ncbi:MAG: thiamine diphosphokinase [Bacillota bacterium]|nr:thiamine diphosphokinase [Bacillota bacterium]
MIINILAGGPEELLPDLMVYSNHETMWVGVDRGVFVLLSRGINPNIAFGDFDSVTDAEWNQINNSVDTLKKYKSEKDETDLELALNWALEQNPSEIRMFGCTGGRLDHFLANMQMLVKPLNEQNESELYLIDKQNIIFIKGPGEHTIKNNSEIKYVSFLPFSMDVKNFSLNGFKYPLLNRHISVGSTLCISNELISNYGTFSFSEGILIVVRSTD